MVADIKAAVCEHYGLPPEAMTSRRRHWATSHPRQIAMFLTREITGRSYPCIGRMFGGRDHSTVIHAVKAVGRRAEDADHLLLLREQLNLRNTGDNSGSAFVSLTGSGA